MTKCENKHPDISVSPTQSNKDSQKAGKKNTSNTMGKHNNTPNSPPQSYEEYQETIAPDEKNGIAKFLIAEKIVPRYKSVFLDAGSTVHSVAKALFLQEKEERQNLTILTNNMKIFATYNGGLEAGGPPVAHSLSLLLTGGLYDKYHEALFGDEAKRSLDSFLPYTVVMGTSGLRIDEGPFYHGHTPEGVIKRAIYEKPTHYRVIVCDHNKLNVTDSFCAGKMDQILHNVTGRAYIVTSYIKQPETDNHEEMEKYKRYTEFVAQFKKLQKELEESKGNVKFCLAIVDSDGTPKEMHPLEH
jgi:DeoR/GlpR family transcriptional regulator of sugar metabolism